MNKRLNTKSFIISGNLAILLGLLLLSFKAGEEWPGKKNKNKIEKEVSGIWDKTSFSFEENTKIDSAFSDRHKKAYIIKSKQKTSGYAYIGRVNTHSQGGEYFDYFLILDKDIEIKRVEILTYNATYGHQITSKNWLKQFLGFKGNHTLKYGNDIQAVSGATISGKAITSDIKETVHQLKTLKRQNKL